MGCGRDLRAGSLGAAQRRVDAEGGRQGGLHELRSRSALRVVGGGAGQTRHRENRGDFQRVRPRIALKVVGWRRADLEPREVGATSLKCGRDLR